MGIEIIKVENKSQLKEFVQLPYRIYANNPYWVPPLKSEELSSLSKDTNPFLEECDLALWIARKDNKCVGRIGAIIHHPYVAKIGEKKGRFTRLEFEDDIEILKVLIQTAETWLRDRDMEKIEGPLGFSNLDHQGMLVEGFDRIPSVNSEYHMPYYHKYIEQLQYKKEADWIEFRLDITEMQWPEKAIRVEEYIVKRHGLKIRHFQKRKEMAAFGPAVFKIMNEAFSELFSVSELNDKCIQYYLNKYLPILNPKYVKFLLNKDDEPIGFTISLPSLSKAMQKAKGKLFPFGFYHIKKALDKPTECDIILTAILPKYQKFGGTSILFRSLQDALKRDGIYYMETTGMLETNHKAISNWKYYKHEQHKRKRCYYKIL